MLYKLRNKFILTNMLLVSLVLLCVFGVLVISSARQAEADSISAMEMAIHWRGDNPSPFEFSVPKNNEAPERRFMIPAFCVAVNVNGDVLSVSSRNDVKVSDEVLHEAVKQAMSKSSPIGKLSGLGLRYLVRDEGAALRIAFSDLGWERDSLTRLIVTSLLVGLGALVLFFFISLLLSRLALRPVEKAWAQQRQFVADASHELKTPLTVILANIGIVLDRSDETVSAQKKWLTYIQDEASRMKVLVEDLLFLAKNDDGKPIHEFTSANLSDIVTGCVLRFETVAYEKGINLESDIETALSVHGSGPDLDRMTGILMDNAVKYTPVGELVSLSLRGDSEKITLTVKNTGSEIRPDHLEHIFERFYRADTSRCRESGGYGLGLAIAHSIVSSHHGSISVTSGGQSTVFAVSFPRK